MIKAKNLYLLLANDVSNDSQDNMNSILKVIDTFKSEIDKEGYEKFQAQEEKTPGKAALTVPIKYYAASSWILDKRLSEKTTFGIDLETVDPNNDTLASAHQEFKIDSGLNKVTVNVGFLDLYITKSGKYLVKATLTTSDHKSLASAEYPYEVDVKWPKEDKKA
jgi:hypothetical protein